MSWPEPIEGFLEERQAEGQHDSRGEFTLSGEEAWRKLGRGQLPPHPEAWILPLVQAANRACCSKMLVRLGRRSTRVALEGEWSWSLPDLEGALLGAPRPESPLHSLAAGLRALLTGPRAGSLLLSSPGGERLRWNGERLVAAPGSRSSSGHTVLEVDHLPPGRGWSRLTPRLSEGAAVVAGLQHTLAGQAMASPVPIWCDGRLLSGLERAVERPDRRILAYLPVGPGPVPALPFPVPSRWRSERWKDEASFSLAPTPGREFADGPSAAVVVLSVAVSQREETGGVVSLGQSRGSRILWIRDGVVVGQQALPLSGSLELTVFASAQGLPTDLSDLALQQGKELLRRQQAIGSLVATTLQRLRDEGEGDAFRVKGVGGKFLPLLGAGVVVVSLFSPVGGLSFAGLSSLVALQWRNGSEEESQRMDLQLERELNSLPRKLRTVLDTRD